MANETVGTLVVKLQTDASGLDDGLDRAQSKFGGFKNVVTGMAMGVGLGMANMALQAGQSLMQFGSDSVDMASDLGETMSKVGVVFADEADFIKDWAKTAATALGMSQNEALAAASTFGNLFYSMGLTGEQTGDMSKSLVELAADLASFNNIDPQIALEKLRAGMLGQAEPMQALGVNMTAAMVSAKALEMGLAATTEELTPAMLAQARYAIILEQTTLAQGDFARTSDGLANQQRIMDAQWADLQTTIGSAFLPVMLALTQALNSLLQGVLPPLSAFVRNQVTPAFKAIGDTIGPVIRSFQDLGSTMQAQTNGPLAYLANWFAENMPRIQAIVDRVVGAITGFWTAHGAQIMAVVRPLLEWLVGFWDTQLRTLLDIVTAVLQVLTGDFSGAGETLRGIWGRWWEFLSTTFTNMRDGIVTFFASVNWPELGWSVITGIASGISNAGSLLWAGASVAGPQIGAWFQSVDWGAVGWAVLQAIATGLLGTGRLLYDTASTIGSGIGQWFAAVDWGAIGLAIVQGIGAGITNAGGWLQGQVQGVAQGALDAAKNALGIHSPSTAAAEQIGRPFAQGVAVGFDEALAGVTARIGASLSGMAGGMAMAPATSAPRALGNITIAQYFYGATDPAAVRRASEDGVLAGLRARGLQ